MSDHTAGPWHVYGSFIQAGIVHIAQLVHPVNAADARLIAAAPELLAALELAAELTHDLHLPSGNPDPEVERINAQIRLVISKTRGEQS